MMITLKKIWSFIKNYWYIPLIAIAAVFAIVLGIKNSSVLTDMFKTAQNNHEKEVEIINNAQKKENEQKAENQKKFDEALQQIEAQKKKDEEELAKKKEEEVKKLIEECKDDPEILSKKVADEFGLKVKRPEDIKE